MSDEIICRRCNGKQQRRRIGRRVQLPDWLMMLHSFSRLLGTYPYVLRTTKYIREKKKRKKRRSGLGMDMQNICMQNFKIYFLKTAWTFGLLCGKRAFCVVACNYLVLV